MQKIVSASILALLLLSTAAFAQVNITASGASGYIGKTATVCGSISLTTMSPSNSGQVASTNYARRSRGKLQMYGRENRRLEMKLVSELSRSSKGVFLINQEYLCTYSRTD